MSDKDIRDEILERATLILLSYSGKDKISRVAEGFKAIRSTGTGSQDSEIARRHFDSIEEAFAWVMEGRDGR